MTLATFSTIMQYTGFKLSFRANGKLAHQNYLQKLEASRRGDFSELK